jgi:HK97 family phage portal protein
MANIITTTRMAIAEWIAPEKALRRNLFNDAFFQSVGLGWTRYDTKGQTYVDKGYNENPDVYSIVSQIARKFSSVPGVVKEVKDKKALKQLRKLYTKALSPRETLLKSKLEVKAFAEDSEEIDEPLERPNYYQSDTEFKELWETFMLLTGNAYQWMLSPDDGINAGVPMSRFLLPSHLMQIVLKENVGVDGSENPIAYFLLVIGNNYARFSVEDVIHSAFPNPNYDLSGSHLYGQSPLRAALRDIQLSNSTIDYGNDTMNNGGIYGFIHAKDGQTPLTEPQAAELKSRLIEMKSSKEVLGRIAGASAPLGFTQVSVDTDKFQPQTYSDAAQKHIANCLGWSVLLLNSDAKYDNIKAVWQMAISNRIAPDLKIYADGLNTQYYPRFKNLKNAEVNFDVSELQEMQANMKDLTEWMATALENGAITPDEFRISLRYPAKGTPEMEQHYLKTGIDPIEDVAVSDRSIAKAFNLE